LIRSRCAQRRTSENCARAVHMHTDSVCTSLLLMLVRPNTIVNAFYLFMHPAATSQRTNKATARKESRNSTASKPSLAPCRRALYSRAMRLTLPT
jgi:hypothetical protein